MRANNDNDDVTKPKRHMVGWAERSRHTGVVSESRRETQKKKKVKGQSDESLDKKNDVNSPMRHVFYQRKRENWAEQENSGFS